MKFVSYILLKVEKDEVFFKFLELRIHSLDILQLATWKNRFYEMSPILESAGTLSC